MFIRSDDDPPSLTLFNTAESKEEAGRFSPDGISNTNSWILSVIIPIAFIIIAS
jgi:hypothetical protein